MRNLRSSGSVLIILSSLLILLKLVGVIGVSWTEILSFASMFLGINIFYSSIIKENRNGIFLGSVLFQIGILIYITFNYELTDTVKIFIPAVLVVFGISLLLTNIFQKSNSYISAIAIVLTVSGVFLLIFRGSLNLTGYFISVYEILKDYSLMILFVLIILFSIWEFRKDG